MSQWGPRPARAPACGASLWPAPREAVVHASPESGEEATGWKRAPLQHACKRHCGSRSAAGRFVAQRMSAMWKGGVSLSVEDLAIEQLDQMGPIDYVVIEFPDGKHRGEAAPLLMDLVDRGIVRILDLMFITKEQDGSVSGVEISDLDGDGMGEFRVFEGASSGLLTEEDRNEAGNALEPGAAALII